MLIFAQASCYTTIVLTSLDFDLGEVFECCIGDLDCAAGLTGSFQ